MIRQWIPKDLSVLPCNEVEDCCGGYPDMSKLPEGCPVCGCRESGNASYTCDQHYEIVNTP